MSFDELHKLFADYYDVMEITPDGKKKREDCAFAFYEAVWFIFMLIYWEYKNNRLAEKKEYADSLRMRLEDYLMGNDVYFDSHYLEMITEEIVDTTFRHLDDEEEIEEEEDTQEIEKPEKKKPANEEPNYWLSEERAIAIAENESNTVWNTVDYTEAKNNGLKYKVWLTEEDDKVRYNHMMVDMMKIPIDQPFPVGSDSMLYPHDYVNGSPENLINCRCSIKYE